MTRFAGPFNSGGGASFEMLKWRRMMSALFPDGVIIGALNELAVTTGSGLTVNVDTGRAIANGEYFENDASFALTLTPDGTFGRYYLIVAHINESASTDSAGVAAYSGDLVALAGTPNASPTVPSVTQTLDTVWEIPLAAVLVPAGAASSSSFTITDLRVFVGALSRWLANKDSAGESTDAIQLLPGGGSQAARLALGGWSANAALVETIVRARHNGSDQDVFHSFPDATGASAALIKVGSDPSTGIHIRLGNMSVFSGSGNTLAAAHGLGQTPNMIIITPHGTTAEPVAFNNLGATTVDIYCTGAWTAMVIAQA